MPTQQTNKYNSFVVRLYWFAIVALVAATLLTPKGQDVIVINGNHTVFQDEFFRSITRLGEGWIFIPVFAASLFIRYSLSLSIASMMVLHGVVCAFAKRVLFAGAPRPSAVLDSQLLYFVPNVEVHALHSFPSGHTATIFCFAVLASMLVRHRFASVVILIIALVVGYSRIYLLQHFLIDVTAGAVVGTGSALAVLYLFDRANFPSSWSSGLTHSRRKPKALRRTTT